MAYQLAHVLEQPNLQIWIWEEDGGFIAKCLDIPGCIAEGDTRDEALANIYDAIANCLEVIREDSKNPDSTDASVEMIQRPISDFLATH